MLQATGKHCRLIAFQTVLAFLLASCSTEDYYELSITGESSGRIIATAGEVASLGPRNAGTPQEERVAEMIITSLTKEKIRTVRHGFDFQTYEMDSSILVVDGEAFTPEFMGMNPYDDEVDFHKNFVLYGEMQGLEVGQDRIIIADRPDAFFVALQAAGSTFVMLKEEDYARLKELPGGMAHLKVKGQAGTRSSSNIEALIGNNDSDAGAIYLTAHYDSYLESPGANDNGTGLAALLEMAFLLKKVERSLPVNVHLVFLGAEEVGILGSRVFVNTQIEALQKCKLVINFDTFGGNQGPYVATSMGVSGEQGEGVRDRLDTVLLSRALEGPEGEWRLLHPALLPMVMAHNYPGWVQQIVDSAAKVLDMEIYSQSLLSDHLSFAQAGIPAISIQSREHQIHSINDTPANLNPETIQSCFLLSWEVLKQVLQSNE